MSRWVKSRSNLRAKGRSQSDRGGSGCRGKRVKAVDAFSMEVPAEGLGSCFRLDGLLVVGESPIGRSEFAPRRLRALPRQLRRSEGAILLRSFEHLLRWLFLQLLVDGAVGHR